MPRKYHVPDSERKRTKNACDACKKRRQKCTGDSPCSACVNKKTTCQYSSPEKNDESPNGANHLSTSPNASASTVISTLQPSSARDTDLGPPVDGLSRHVVLPDQSTFLMHTKTILLACGVEDASFLSLLDHEVTNGQLSHPHGTWSFVIPDGVSYNNSSVDSTVLLYASLYEKHHEMTKHIKYFSKLLVMANNQQQETRIPDIGVAENVQLRLDDESMRRGAACLASAIRTIWCVERANRQGHSAQSDFVVLYFLFSAALVILCHEYVGAFETQESLHAAYLSMKLLASWSEADPKANRASKIIAEFYELVDITNKLNSPHRWKMTKELLIITHGQHDHGAAALFNAPSSACEFSGTKSNIATETKSWTNDSSWTSASTTPSATSSCSASDFGAISSDISVPFHELDLLGMNYSHSFSPYPAAPLTEDLGCDCGNHSSPTSGHQSFK